MRAERLLQLYDRVSEAPDAIPKLRRFILDLAVRGKLVEQDPEDEPASELLKRIALHKQELVQAGEAKAQKHLPAATRQDLSFDIPSTWEPARLADVAVCLDYMRRPINGSERAKRIEGKSETELYPYYGATQQQGWIDDYIFDHELVLLGEDGVPFFDPMRTKAYLISGKSWVNNHAHVFKGLLISSPFLAQYLNVFDYTGRVVGATRSKLNQARAIDIPVPLPPRAEQHRIVAKVDELMALCDSLEAEREKREATRDRLTMASLSRLTAPDVDEKKFKAHADFAIKVLPELTTRPDQIKALRQTILDLAVRGKLVEQNPEDGNGKELLRSIGTECGREANSGRQRGDLAGADVSEDEKYLDVPATWAWARIRDLGATQTGTSPSSSNAAFFGSFVPFVKPGDLNGDRITSVASGLSEEGMQYSRVAPKGSVLMVCIGATLGKVNTTDQTVCFNQQINSVTPYLGGMHSFLALALKTSGFQRLAWSKAGTGTLPIINKSKWETLAIPIPPLGEQRRIVAKVEELMALCNQLEQRITIGEGTRRRLLEIVLFKAFDPLVPEAA